jgi:PAS domain-containing protein
VLHPPPSHSPSAGLGSVADRTYPRPVDVRLHAFPSRDREFVEYVDAAWGALPAPRTIETLQDALRARYPAAIVTAQHELARHDEAPVVWYAFRTAAIGTPTVDDAPERDAAWAILDDERRFLEVSPELAKIAELPARRMVGRQVEDFSNPADPSIREDIARLWAEFRSGGALASTLRFNYADGRPREVAYRLEADADGQGRHRLSVRVLPPKEERPL